MIMISLVEFPQYVFPSKQEQLRNVIMAVNNKVLDRETAFDVLYADEYDEEYIKGMLEKEKELIVIRLQLILVVFN